MYFYFKRAKEQGAVFVRDIWEENDEFGSVRFATVKTVSYFTNHDLAGGMNFCVYFFHFFVLTITHQVRRYDPHIC